MYGAVGSVVNFHRNKIVVQFWGTSIFSDFIKRSFHPNALKKLNKFNVNDIIQIKSNELIAEQIEKEFGRIQIVDEKVLFIFLSFYN